MTTIVSFCAAAKSRPAAHKMKKCRYRFCASHHATARIVSFRLMQPIEPVQDNAERAIRIYGETLRFLSQIKD